jgi:predicted nucleic acid-binding protein
LSWYLDSSAILKTIFDEKERPDLLRFLNSQSTSSRLSKIEVRRTVARLVPTKTAEVNLELDKINFLPISNPILMAAENFSSEITLRTLDAIHIATVMSLEGSIEGLITYDRQMIANAKLLGIKVISPGMT